MKASRLLMPLLAEIDASFEYCPESGVLTRKAGVSPGRRKVRPARVMRCDSVKVNGRNMRTHRVIWALYHRAEPPAIIDHIDGDPTNNRIANLRPATHSQNARNRRSAQSNSTSGVLGISFHKNRQKWTASIKVNRRDIFLGYFDTLAEAVLSRVTGEVLHHKEFAASANAQFREIAERHFRLALLEINEALALRQDQSISN